MRRTWVLILRPALVASAALMAYASSHATISCNLTSNGFSSAYVPANVGTNITSASLTMTCTRNLTGDASSQFFSVKVNNGVYASGQANHAASGADRILYDVYIDSACANLWKANAQLSGTINLGAVGVPASLNVQYWGCIPAGQTTVPAGTYVDTVIMTPSIGSNATFPVSIVTPSSCTISSAPTNMTFNYVAFQGSAAIATSNFSTTCTSLLPYTMALDATVSVLTGLGYTLSLSASSSVGTGVAQPFTINGAMAAGQAGACATGSCSASESRTLTITY